MGGRATGGRAREGDGVKQGRGGRREREREGKE